MPESSIFLAKTQTKNLINITVNKRLVNKKPHTAKAAIINLFSQDSNKLLLMSINDVTLKGGVRGKAVNDD